jgi:hypothetical protein
MFASASDVERHESIAALVNGLDESRHTSMVTKRHSYAPHRCVETVLEVDEGSARPKPATQVLARNDSARVLEQRRQNAERLLLDSDAKAPFAELAALDIELEGCEPHDVDSP